MRIACSTLSLFLVMIAVPADSFADDALPERDFLEQSIRRVKHVQSRAADYDDYVRNVSVTSSRDARRSAGHDSRNPTTMLNRGMDINGPRSATNLQRVQFDVRTLKRKAGKASDELIAMRRQVSLGEELDRESIEATVEGLEREADDLQRELRRL